MNSRLVRHLIANLRRHYNLQGTDILACYDTGLIALFPRHVIEMKYVTVSVSPTHWRELSAKLNQDAHVKHPGSGVPCLKLFGKLYVRSQARVGDMDVEWSKVTLCYTPTARYLRDSFERILMGSRITRDQMEHANNLISKTMSIMSRKL